MNILIKILKSKFFLIPLVLGVGTFFTVLLGTSDTLFWTQKNLFRRYSTKTAHQIQHLSCFLHGQRPTSGCKILTCLHCMPKSENLTCFVLKMWLSRRVLKKDSTRLDVTKLFSWDENDESETLKSRISKIRSFVKLSWSINVSLSKKIINSSSSIFSCNKKECDAERLM